MATVVAERHGSWAAVWAKRESLYVLGPVFFFVGIFGFFFNLFIRQTTNLIISPSSEVRIY